MALLSEDAVGKLRRLMEARDQRDADEIASKNSEREYREQEAAVYEALAEDNVRGSIKVDLGEPWGVVRFGARETFFARVIDEDRALEYYESRAMLEEVSKPKLVMRRLNDDVREAREQGLDVPPGLDWYARRGVTITRQKS
mgnify:CR=1 FL=1